MSCHALIRRPDVSRHIKWAHINDPKPNEYDQKELFQEIAKTNVILPLFAQSCYTCWQCLQFALGSISEKTTDHAVKFSSEITKLLSF